MAYRVIRGRWCNIIVLTVKPPSKEKCDDSKKKVEELQQVFDHFPKHYKKILLGNFNAKLEREGIFKPTIGNDSLHQDSNDYGI